MTNTRWWPYDCGAVQTETLDGARLLFRGTHDAQSLLASPCVVVAGVFDGLHRGHQELVSAAVADAAQRGIPCIAVSFDPDPMEVLRPEASPLRLLHSCDRADGLIELGVDAVLLLDFNVTLSREAPAEFVSRELLSRLHPVCIHVGTNFTFGHQGAGNVDTLREMGAAAGFETCAHELLALKGGLVSATRIRRLLLDGRLDDANELLGRCHYIRGQVQHGRGEGTGFGFPTANVQCDLGDCLPAEGVYACYAIIGTSAWPAATNVGAPRSFATAAMPAFLETNLIGFSGDLYDCDMCLAFVKWLRAPRTFGSLDELKSVVLDNIAWVAEHLGNGELRLEEI